MKKTILSVAVLLASTLGFTAAAQSPTNSPTCNNPAQCQQAGKANKTARPNPFEGLNLTEQQQTELQALTPQKSGVKGNKAQNGEKADKTKEQAKAEKQAKRAENRQKMIQNRRDYLAKVKDILTPEQYVQFLENNYVNRAAKSGARNGKLAQGPNRKGQKGNKRNQRGNKQDMNAGQQQNANDSNSAYYIDNGKIMVFPYHAQR